MAVWEGLGLLLALKVEEGHLQKLEEARKQIFC